ncbi:hypothetical protein GCM10007880_61710 [Mesorhizobium amorphae]|uniref:hypothetical protein n=1 Tax=Mesorhizobium amorphae TaxID=71433 RepID=UPI00235BF95E|nr:hypothetical protein [Mesorhizobium amorphae]GLR45653.1 hypothetical protein GCM10007880_61710 [Mesorhizobium amorphae]
MRTVIHEVVADIDEEASEIVLLIHWIGVHTELRLPRRRQNSPLALFERQTMGLRSDIHRLFAEQSWGGDKSAGKTYQAVSDVGFNGPLIGDRRRPI